jgi:endoglucanase
MTFQKVVGKLLAPVVLGMALTTSAAHAYVDLIGLNIAGAEFTSHVLPGQLNKHYFFPKNSHLQYWAERGIRNIRFPIKWERLQPRLNGAFDPFYAAQIDKLLADAAKHDMDVILDVHNYGRYRGGVVGTKDVPLASYQNLLERMAQRWGKHPALYGYDIMNEPYGLADQYWPKAAQAGINGVRKFDRDNIIFIEGASYSSAARWPRYADQLLDLKDPADNIVFSAHVYLDKDASGRYIGSPGKNFDTNVGVKRVTPFIEWLKKNGKRGHIGEIGVPPHDALYLEAMNRTLAHLQKHCIPVAYFAAGPAWGNHFLSVEPKDGKEKPQWRVLKKYVGKGNCTDFGPGR